MDFIVRDLLVEDEKIAERRQNKIDYLVERVENLAHCVKHLAEWVEIVEDSIREPRK